MSDSDFEKRKTTRRKSLEKKMFSDRIPDFPENRDQRKIKKAFKKQKEELLQDELWEEWEDYQ